ncbi:MAG TPA: sodium:solute symporter family protein [Syntrophorhabdaceae bacterium]|nr:sodium:solute symporter family protein [Syntrophorhabdaceae bacterium]
MLYLIVFTIIYLAITIYLSYLGYKKTTTVSDYLLAGRQVHPVTMSLSYGSTYISTSAIIGFGGVSALYGFSMSWLAFLNILVGVWIAFVVFGKRTRKMGKALDAHTFPELLGRRYNSRFIQGFSGFVILFFMPVYTAAILIGISRFIEVYLRVPFATALLVFLLINACYVIWGGLKGVLYTSAFQGIIMIVVMIIIGITTYFYAGGLIEGHRELTSMTSYIPQELLSAGHNGFTSFPLAGSPIWWFVITTMILGVGIGVLGQPQLNVRFMTLKSDRELNRSIPFTAIYILFTTGIAFTVGVLTNVIFYKNIGMLSIEAVFGNVDKIIPMYIDRFYPQWFVAIFLVTLMSAAMSANSAQFLAMGASLSRDIFEQALLKGKSLAETTIVTRIGIVFSIFATLILGLLMPEGIVAVATAFFFGLCGATFIPAYLFGLYWKRGSKTAAKASILCGFFSSLIWMLFFHENESRAIGICRFFFGSDTLAGHPFNMIDPQVIALPLSFIVFIVVSYLTRPVSQEVLRRAFRHI